jgi:hypothetical protein
LPRLEQSAAALLACFCLLYLPVYLMLPLGRDQGMFAWVGMVVRDGGLPFRDAWEIKGPLTHLVYGVAVMLAGPHGWGVRLVDVLFLLAGMGCLSVGVRPRVRAPVALVGALLLFLLYSSDYWHAAQPDGWASLMLLGCLVLFFKDGGARRARVAVLSGVLLGAMALLKPLFGLFCVLVPLYAWASEPRAWRRNVGFVAQAALVAVGTVGLLLLFFWWRGALDALLDVHLRFNPSVHLGRPARGLGDLFLALMEHLLAPSLLALHLLGVAGWVVLGRSERREVALLVAAWLVGVLVITFQNKFYPYHFFVIVPQLLVGLCFALQAASEWGEGHALAARIARRSLAWVLLAVCLATPVGKAFEYARYSIDFAQGRLSLVEYRVRFDHADYHYSEIVAIAEHLTETTRREDTVLVYGFDPAIHFFADRHSPSRFGFHYPLFVGPPDMKARYRAELLEALAARPPQAIVLAEVVANNLYGALARDMERDFPELSAILLRDYTLELRTPHYTLLRRQGR